MRALATLVLALLATACGTTIYPDHYAHDCDADNQCVRISVGDQCSCACDLSAINVRDYDNYISDLERIGACRNTCGAAQPDAGPYTCGEGIGARCSGGTCTTYSLPDAGAD